MADARRNLVNAVTEFWRPPVFQANAGRIQNFVAALRRFFDLQAGSLWKDLKQDLGAARGTVLDVGCGAQPYRTLLPATIQYIGVDTHDAREKFGYAMPDTVYFTGDVLPLDRSSVDLVLCAEVLEHVLEPVHFLSEINRCLKNGGRVIMTVPFSARWHFVPYDYWRYTPSGIKHLLEKTGFSEILVTARGNPFTVACYKIMALLLPLLFSSQPGILMVCIARMLGIVMLPFLIVLAALANLTMTMDWGEDCLGYTVTALVKK